jgi:uncharacterized protein
VETQPLEIPDILSEEDSGLVLTILGIYGDLKYSFAQLKPTDQSGINQNDLTFRGFSGNDETALMSFADALADRGRYETVLRKDGNNSHFPMREKYQAMIRKWEESGKPHNIYNRETIIKILDV